MASEPKSLLSPSDSALILIDHQPQMSFGVQSIDRQTLLNNTVGLAKAAKVFNVPTILTSVAAKTFSGDIWPEITRVFPEITPIDRTSMNAWEDDNFVKAVKATGRKRLVIAALWTEVCLIFPALSASEEGFDVFAVADASGGTTVVAHDMAMQRMIQAGVKPVTWMQVMLEWQRDWNRQATYDPVMTIAKEHGGAYGIGVVYAKSILGEHASEAGDGHAAAARR